MDNELQTLVQLLELQGRGLGAFARAIRFTAKGAKSGVDVAKVKLMQHKIRLHYASEGKHDTLRLKNLEKITGGQYNILNIPLEEESKLIDFYDRLKRMHVSFAELPDLQVGDGYTQIAYNPMDAEKVKFVVQQYRKYLREDPKEIGVDEYMEMAGPDGEELLAQLAEKGYKDEMHVEHLERIQKMAASKEYIPVSINVESLLVSEDKDSYTLKMPKGRTGAAMDHFIIINKNDVLLLDQGQTIFTVFKEDDKIPQYHMKNGEIIKEYPLIMDGKSFCEAFAPVDKDRIEYVKELQANRADIFPSFFGGAEIENENVQGTSGPAPETPKETMENILHLEQLKKRESNPEYLSLSFDMAQMVAEDKNMYVANLPNYMDEKAELIRCLKIDKEDAIVSEDGKRLFAYLKRTDSSDILEYNAAGKKVREFEVNNEMLAKDVLKDQYERAKGVRMHTKEHLEQGKEMVDEISKVVPMKKK